MLRRVIHIEISRSAVMLKGLQTPVLGIRTMLLIRIGTSLSIAVEDAVGGDAASQADWVLLNSFIVTIRLQGAARLPARPPVNPPHARQDFLTRPIGWFWSGPMTRATF